MSGSSLDRVLKRERTTNWRAIYIATLMMALAGINMSIFFMALWPYMNLITDNASMEWLGWVVSGNSLGCLVANLTFGWWAQKTMRTAHPLIFGFSMAALGNLIYAILPNLPQAIVLPAMLTARILTGFCTGCLGVLRSFTAMSSTAHDRLKAVATLSTGLTIGLSIGPVIQMCFMPIGEEGITILGVPLNEYTSPGYLMAVVGVICVILLMTLFEENYVGIISDEEKEQNPWLVIPKFDRLPVFVLFYIWCLLMTVGTTIYAVATPFTMAMYKWTSGEAVTRNAMLQTGSCLMSAITNSLLGRTRLGGMDRRKQLILGLTLFLGMMIAYTPWFFYPGPLVEEGTLPNATFGCNYDWCYYTNRIPLPLYCICFVVCMGCGFPLCMTALNTRISEVLGPRKQSIVQGFMAFTGSLAQFMMPHLVTFLFERNGFRPVALLTFGLHLVGIALILLVFRRMVPLQMQPPIGEATKYKRGTFYHF